MLIFKMEKSINTVNMYLDTVHEKFIIHIWGDLMELYEEILKHYLTSQKCIICLYAMSCVILFLMKDVASSRLC